MARILLVEDDRACREGLATALRDLEFEVVTAEDANEAMCRLRLMAIDLVVSDVVLGRTDGIGLLSHIRDHHPDIPVILVTGHASIPAAVEAMRHGAFDYLAKPIDLTRLEMIVERCLGVRDSGGRHCGNHGDKQGIFGDAGVVGRSPAMQRVVEQIEQVAPTRATVLILGESGTGKELLASAIHCRSQRAEGPLVKVNCAALPESLIESELFGHERGAFTGAHRSRRGRFELAHHGTLFLDEVGDLALATQIKLLRALQEREIERVGGQTPIPVDVRLVTATNCDLLDAMAKGRFREELYYRLKVVTIEIPPLRERREDIEPLLRFFFTHYCREHGRQLEGFSPKAKELLCEYDWPGNVRELRNLVESLVVTARSPLVQPQHLPASVTTRPPTPRFSVSLGRPLEQIEEAYILKTLGMLDGNKTKAAQVLGIGKKTLYRRLQRYQGSGHWNGAP